MAARFTNERLLKKLEITDLRKQQLAVLDDLYFSDVAERSILELREVSADDDPDGAFWADNTSLWDVSDGDTLLYEAYMYGADSGTIFKAGTTDVVAEIIQCGLQVHDGNAAAALHEAEEESDVNDAHTFTL